MKIKKNGDLYHQTLLLIICCCMGTLQCMKKTNFLDKSHADNKHKNIPQHNGNKIEIKHLEDVSKITSCLQDYRKNPQHGRVQEQPK